MNVILTLWKIAQPFLIPGASAIAGNKAAGATAAVGVVGGIGGLTWLWNSETTVTIVSSLLSAPVVFTGPDLALAASALWLGSSGVFNKALNAEPPK